MAHNPDTLDTPTITRPEEKNSTRRIPPYHVILLNDDHHSMEFVVGVLCKTIGCNVEKAIQYMLEAHQSGRAVVWTGSREVAELKVDQITSCHEVRTSDNKTLGPLGCLIEPAPGA